jgi:hypothetical protein
MTNDAISQKIKAKRTTKNSVFLDLFHDKKNLLKLYQTLHPEDTTATENSLDIVTIENVLTDNLYNDLGILVGGTKLLLLIESQATWTLNILIRILLYLAQTYQEYFNKTTQSLYKTKKVQMPKPELYVIYTGSKDDKPDIISLSEEFFHGEDIDIEVKAKVIYESDTNDIINQYIIFCKVFDDQRRLYSLTEQTVKETIRICKDRNVLKEYLESKETEVQDVQWTSVLHGPEWNGDVTIMMSLFDQEQIMDTFLKDRDKEVAKETAKRMIEDGEMPLEKISRYVPSLTMDELKEIKAEVMQLTLL